VTWQKQVFIHTHSAGLRHLAALRGSDLRGPCNPAIGWAAL